MKKYHVATGDGKAYYGVNYESYREAEAVLRFSQKHDPQAHIVEEEYHFTNADRIRAMSNRELAAFLAGKFTDHETTKAVQKGEMLTATYISEMAHTWFSVWMQWLQQPAKEGQ